VSTAMATPGWDYTRLPLDQEATLSVRQRNIYSEGFKRVLRSDPEWTHPNQIPHPHELPLVELLRQARVTRGPGGRAPTLKMLTRTVMLEVFAGNPDFHVEDVPDPETGALQTLVRVTEGPATCAECAAAGTVVGDRHRQLLVGSHAWWTRRCLEREARHRQG
jgi:hypothetical protein